LKVRILPSFAVPRHELLMNSTESYLRIKRFWLAESPVVMIYCVVGCEPYGGIHLFLVWKTLSPTFHPGTSFIT